MVRALLSRWLPSHSRAVAHTTTASRVVVESVPPLAFGQRSAWSSWLGDWLAASGWRIAGTAAPTSLGRRSRRAAVAHARLDFADALLDIHTDAAADALDRIAVTRSLHELWHLRAEIFSRVAERGDQAEAMRRLAQLDRHFPQRTHRSPSRRRAADARR